MKALDVACPTCARGPGSPCVTWPRAAMNGIHQARIDAAAKAERDANRARREAARR